MANRSTDQDPTEGDIADVLAVVEGAPLEFAYGGATWQLRQPTPAEMTRLRLWYTIAEHQAWADVEAANLSKNDVNALVENAGTVGYLRAKHELETNHDERAALAARIDDLTRKDRSNTYETIAVEFALAERDRRALELLLVCDDDKRAAFLGSAGAIEAARPTVWRAITLARTVPNWQAHKALTST